MPRNRAEGQESIGGIDKRFMNKRRLMLGLVLLNAVQVLLLHPVASEFFTGDGLFYLARTTAGWDDVAAIFSRLDDAHNYRPLTYLLTTPLISEFGLDPLPYHSFTIAAHLGITWLVFWMARLLLGANAPALGVAWLFGLHVAGSRVAFGITFVPDLSYAAFYIVAIAAFIKSEKSCGRRWYVISIISFILSLLCKEAAVTLPAAISLAIMLVPGISSRPNARPHDWRYAIRRTVPLWAVAGLYLGWFAYLTGGRFTPQDPNHPYHVVLSWDTFLSKAQYLLWGLNLRRYDTMAGHPTVMAIAGRWLDADWADAFARRSDFWLYLIGPVWLVWLVIKGDWEHLSEFWVDAFFTPIMAVVLAVLIYHAFARRKDADKTVWFGISIFILILTPVLMLPAAKTMLHNLYVPWIGLALAVAHFSRKNWYSASYPCKLAATFIPAVIVAAGIYNSARHLKEGWPTITSRQTRSYLEDLRHLHPQLPRGVVLQFDEISNPSWPFLTAGGDLFRLYYRDPTLAVLSRANGHEIRSNRMVIRLREVAGRVQSANHTN